MNRGVAVVVVGFIGTGMGCSLPAITPGIGTSGSPAPKASSGLGSVQSPSPSSKTGAPSLLEFKSGIRMKYKGSYGIGTDLMSLDLIPAEAVVDYGDRSRIGNFHVSYASAYISSAPYKKLFGFGFYDDGKQIAMVEPGSGGLSPGEPWYEATTLDELLKNYSRPGAVTFMPLRPAVGQSWNVETGEGTGTAKLERQEAVTVPFKTFQDASKVTFKRPTNSGQTAEVNIWFVPGVGVVKADFQYPVLENGLAGLAMLKANLELVELTHEEN